MKNLFERMTEEKKAIFEIAIIEFPNTLGRVKNDFVNNYYVIDLKFQSVLDFNNYVLCKTFDLADIFYSFNSIDSLD